MPSFVHVITGSGMPDALHWKLTFEPGEATKAFGETATCGATTKYRNKWFINWERLFQFCLLLVLFMLLTTLKLL